MKNLSLPEERALLGKAEGQGIEPVALNIDDDELSRFKEKARVILEQGGRFSTEDLNRIVARNILGV